MTEQATTEPTPEATEAVAAIVPSATSAPTQTPQTTSPSGQGQPALPLEAVVGGLGLLAVLGYAGLYWRGASSAERYPGGFVISHCPVCRQGKLVMEQRSDRVLGIPRVRRIVRCANCRSTLREVGARRWRYNIDPNVNQNMFNRYNGRVLDEDFLRALPNQPHITRSAEPRDPADAPTFVDDDKP